VPIPKKTNAVFEGLLTKLQILGMDDHAAKARAQLDGHHGPHEILAAFTTREAFNPVSDHLSITKLAPSSRTIVIPTPTGGFVYVRCNWDDEDRADFIAKILATASHVQISDLAAPPAPPAVPPLGDTP
jgi:hypothetical protein